MKRRQLLQLGLGTVLLGTLVWIAQLQQRERQGVEAYLELTTTDPRSLMQGDYMILNYRLDASLEKPETLEVKLSPQRVVQLGPGPLRLKARQQGPRLSVGPNSFLFPEGSGPKFAQARYARIRLLPNGQVVLLGLSDEKFQRLNP